MIHVEIRRINDDELGDGSALGGFWRIRCDRGATPFAPSERTAKIWAGADLDHFHTRPMSRQVLVRSSDLAPLIRAAGTATATRTKKRSARTHRSIWTVSGGLPTLGKRR